MKKNTSVNGNLMIYKQLNKMILLTIITQVFILIKNSLVASYFGISVELDAFNLANRIATFIYSFIGAGISTIIIPYLKDKIKKNGINIFISVIYTIGIIFLVLLIIFNDELIYITGSNKNSYFLELSANLLIFTGFTGLIDSLIRLARAIIEFNDKFIHQKIIVLFSNIILVLMLLISDNNNIYYFAIIVLLSYILNLVLHCLLLKRVNFFFQFNFDLTNQTYKEMIRLFFPTILSTGVYEISILIDTLIAARLPAGSISTLNYGNTIINMINVLLIGNITAFVYPRLVKIDNKKQQQISLLNYVLFMNMIMCLLVVLFYSSGKEGISLLFERGKFTSDNTVKVYEIGLILTLGLPTNAIRDLLYRYFYINKDTYTPFKNSIVISGFNILLSVLLSKYFGLYGVAIGTTLASYLSLLLIGIRFKRKFDIFFNKGVLFYENLKIIFITVISTIATMWIKNFTNIFNPFLGFLFYTLFTIIIFLFLLFVMKSKVFKLKL